MAENNKTRFFYVLYSDKTRVFDQSERAYYPIYIIKENRVYHYNIKTRQPEGNTSNCNHYHFVSNIYKIICVKHTDDFKLRGGGAMLGYG